ncbi:hypothetical protein [Fibrella aestuarina]|uniref:hypothetical protein n=1 Tax=Fibrella aestuarina TaxID=651143 RepID=UPI0011D1EEBD|nr:hypothetical protein [Fibrella aestuarina]
MKAQSVDFEPLIKEITETRRLLRQKDSLSLPVLYEGRGYRIELSPNPIPFTVQQTTVETGADRAHAASYSVIYENRLVSLFDSVGFICLTLPTLVRDRDYEKRLNTKSFQYHCLLNGQLVGFSNGRYYALNSKGKWRPYADNVPMGRQPKLAEDDRYIVFGRSHGEWGGTLYFYDKASREVHLTGSSEANTIRKEGDTYLVLSSSGHGVGGAFLRQISAPNTLPVTTLADKNDMVAGYALGNTAPPPAPSDIRFRYDGIQLWSMFSVQDRPLYLLRWLGNTLLAERDGDVFKLVYPLLFKPFYAHNPITTTYGRYTLINYADTRGEVGCLLIDGLTINWLNWSM